MEIPKEELQQMLRNRGDDCKAELVEQQLPTRVDPVRHAERLRRIGIVPAEVLGGGAENPSANGRAFTPANQ
jgi:hypothetical protein